MTFKDGQYPIKISVVVGFFCQVGIGEVGVFFIKRMNIDLNGIVIVLQDINTGESGLTSEEVARRQAQYGANKLAEGNKKTKLQRFMDQLKDPMLIMLIIAAGVSAVTS